MQIHTDIDDKLFHQAAQITGVADKRKLLEQALRLLIQTQAPLSVPNTCSAQPKYDFWEQLQDYRSSTDLSALEDVDEIFANVRDKSAGRPVEL